MKQIEKKEDKHTCKPEYHCEDKECFYAKEDHWHRNSDWCCHPDCINPVMEMFAQALKSTEEELTDKLANE